MVSPLILATGLPRAGVSTRMAALRLALAQDNGFTGYEVDQDGAVANSQLNEKEFDLVHRMLNQDAGTSSVHARSTALAEPRHFRIKAGPYNNRVEVWERTYADAKRALEDHEPDGVVISVPIETESGGGAEVQLDTLIQPLRTKYWSESGSGKRPWVILELTQYETLFCQTVPEMVASTDPRGNATPYTFALRSDVQKIAARSFCLRWRGSNELTRLVSAERRRCAPSKQRRPQAPPRVMVQVSSAWGFLVGGAGPSMRHPANCRHPAEASDGLQTPRFPRLDEVQKRALAALKFGASSYSIINLRDDIKAVEQLTQRFLQVWKPIGVVEPIPSIVWRKPAPNMHWVPDLMPDES